VYSLYGSYDHERRRPSGAQLPDYGFTPETRELISRASAFLFSIKSINVEKLRPEAIESKWTRTSSGARPQGAIGQVRRCRTRKPKN